MLIFLIKLEVRKFLFLTIVKQLFSRGSMEKENWFLPTYTIKEQIGLDDEDRALIKEMVLERCNNWLENYVERFMDNAEDAGEKVSNEDAIDCAKFELQNVKDFEKIQEDSELISCDPIDDFEEYKYQMSIIKEWAENL